MKKILILAPNPKLSGGVTSYVNSLRGKWTCDEVYFYRGGKKGNFLLKIISHIIDYIIFCYKVQLINREDPIFINTSMNSKAFNRDLLFIKICLFFKRNTNVFIHGWNNEFFKSINKKKLNALSSVRSIFVLSEDFKKELIERGFENNIVIETTVVDSEFSSYFDKPKVFDKNKGINILFLARLEQTKGVYVFLESVKHIRKSYCNTIFHVAGFGSETENIKNLVKSMNDDQVIFHGHVTGEKKYELFKNSEFYVLPTSHGEGMPISILEAITAGCIVFSTPKGGIKYLYDNLGIGYVLDNQNSILISNQIVSSLESIKKLETISKNNFYNARKKFSYSNIIKRIEAVIF